MPLSSELASGAHFPRFAGLEMATWDRPLKNCRDVGQAGYDPSRHQFREDRRGYDVLTQSRQEDPKVNGLLRSARQAAGERRALGRIRVGAIYRMGHQREVALQVEGAGGVRTPLIGA